MERRAERYQFRMALRGLTFESGGRVLYEPDGEMTLQIWMRTPEQPDILLEVAEGRDLDDLWRRLHLLAYVRGLVVSEYRTERGARGGWEPIPHGPTPTRDPQTWRRAEVGENGTPVGGPVPAAAGAGPAEGAKSDGAKADGPKPRGKSG